MYLQKEVQVWISVLWFCAVVRMHDMALTFRLQIFVFNLAYRHFLVTWVSNQPNHSQTNMELIQDYIHRRMATRMAALCFCTMDKVGGQ